MKFRFGKTLFGSIKILCQLCLFFQERLRLFLNILGVVVTLDYSRMIKIIYWKRVSRLCQDTKTSFMARLISSHIFLLLSIKYLIIVDEPAPFFAFLNSPWKWFMKMRKIVSAVIHNSWLKLVYVFRYYCLIKQVYYKNHF